MNLTKEAMLKYQELQRYKNLSALAPYKTSQAYYRKTFKSFGDKPMLMEDFPLD